MKRMYLAQIAGIVLICGVAATAVSHGKDAEGVKVVEGIDVLSNRYDEAACYYANNWLVFRKAALEKGYIDSYEFIVDDARAGDVDILLITRFASEQQFQEIEQRYTELMSDRQLVLLNDVQPGDFRRSVFALTSTSGASGSR